MSSVVECACFAENVRESRERASLRCKHTQAYIRVLAGGGGSIAFALVGQAAKNTRDNVYPLAGARGRSCIMLIRCKSSREPREESKAKAASREAIITTEFRMCNNVCARLTVYAFI